MKSCVIFDYNNDKALGFDLKAEDYGNCIERGQITL